ncbi:MAG: hypothetical protein ACM3NQ_14335 [Bacteroidales bacterium]
MNKLFRRPVLGAVVVFLLTIGITRFLNYFWPPLFHVHFGGGVHIHHYVFGIFMITIAGFLALVFKGPRATFGISLLYGFGVAFTFDEFGFWINPPYRLGSPVRWDNTGLVIVLGAFAIVSVLRLLARWWRRREAPQSAGEPQ